MTEHPTDSVEDDDALEIEPRSQEVIVDRLLILTAVVRRLVLESANTNPMPPSDDPDEDISTPEDDLFDLVATLSDSKLIDRTTPFERSLLLAPAGNLGDQAMIAASWSGESAVLLAWALNLFNPLPGWDTETTADLLFDAIPGPGEELGPWRRSLALQPLEALADARELAELWHWRTGVELVRRGATPPERRELLGIVRETALEAAELGLLNQLVDGDFSYRGAAMSSVAESTLDDLAMRASERLRAMNWLCGFGMDWDSVPLDLDSDQAPGN